ncbi:MAG: hypothetical protein IPH03_00490 [Tetrasphaera sp.]|jgi:pimeloyl-ACP methyl ester carboxylesterase|nr:hypothetical protein [Tetrasphaera sp.]
MRATEAREAGTVGGAVLRQLTGLVRGVHLAISDTVHDAVGLVAGPVSRPIQAAQDAVTSGVYAATGLALDTGARVAGHLTATRVGSDDADRPSIHDGSAAHHAIAIGAGLWGDTLMRPTPTIAPAMHVRREGRQVELTREGVAAAYGPVTGDVAVFLHGLFETEAAWRLGADTRGSYADRLRADLGFTPVMVRFNTGLRTSENGRELDALLTALVAAWPVPVTRLVLIGHSMGGLVIHSALASEAAEETSTWLSLVSDSVTLGTPHHGSPIARAVFHAAERLGQSQRASFVAEFLRMRSGGIRDLAHGNVVDADWHGHDPDDHADRRTHPDPRAGIRHHAIAGVAGRRLPAPVGEFVGDLIVSVASASHEQIDYVTRRFTDDRAAVVRGVTHFGLLNDDQTYAHLQRWLAAAVEP